MVKYYNGTVFNCDAEAIVNTVNCLGVMGAGIALEFSLRYPEMFKDYEEKCKRDMIRTGSVDYYHYEDKVIVNFPTKWHFKYPSKIEWVEQGLKDFVSTYRSQGIRSVAFPKLGTYNGGLEWETVRYLMERYLGAIDIPVYICLDTSEAEGLEKKMLDFVNSLDVSSLKPHMRVTEKQMETIERNRPFKRFWMIKELDGIGITVYSKLFNYCKSNAEAPPSSVQGSLFDLL